MINWDTMQVIEEKIAGTTNHFRYTVGNDIIEMKVSYFGDYFEDLHLEILDHYIRNRNNKPSNPNRTMALSRRIYDHLRREYLKELEKVFKDIASQPATKKLEKRFSCMGYTFFEGNTPREVYSWFFRHYSSTCAAGDFHDLIIQVSETDGFLSEEIAWTLDI